MVLGAGRAARRARPAEHHPAALRHVLLCTELTPGPRGAERHSRSLVWLKRAGK